MLHGHSYKPLLSPYTRRVWAQDLHLSFQALEKKFGAQQNSKADWIASYLFIFWCVLWLEKTHPAPLRKKSGATKPGFSVRELSQLVPSSVQHLLSIFSAVHDFSVVSLFSDEPLPGVSDHLKKFFTEVREHRWDVRILNYVPTPEQVLKWQQNGERCVTLLSESQQLAEGFIDQKEPFKFALHDIEHSCHFFSDPYLRDAQIGFYRQIENCFSFLRQQSFLEDPVFQGDFNYLISDMNSHPVHLVKTFHAILLKAFKRQLGYREADKLESCQDFEFLKLWKKVLNELKLADHVKESVGRVNLKEFTPEDAKLIFEYFSGVGFTRLSRDEGRLHRLLP